MPVCRQAGAPPDALLPIAPIIRPFPQLAQQSCGECVDSLAIFLFVTFRAHSCAPLVHKTILNEFSVQSRRSQAIGLRGFQ